MQFTELIRRIGKAADTMEVRAAGDPCVRRLCEDSRKVRAGDLFVARSGTKTSGAKFAADAVAKGAVAIVSNEVIDLPQSIAFAHVSDGNRAMALLAHELAGRPADALTMLAVTGTKGKTTVAYLVRSILKSAGKVCGMIGTVQIDDGKNVIEADMTTPGAVELADYLLKMKTNGAGYCVMETSSHALHQNRLAGIDFEVAMFTNLTGDHLDYHGNMDEYAAAKAILLQQLEPSAFAVINLDDPYAARMMRDCKAKRIPYCVTADDAAAPAGGWAATIRHLSSDGMRLHVRGPGKVAFDLKTPLVGRHNVYNLLCAMSAAQTLGVSMDTIAAGVENNTGAPGRLQPVVPAGRTRDDLPFQVFVDYAHTHDSLQNVLTALRATMKESAKGGRLLCVFGCGGDRDRTKRPKMALVAQTIADRVVVTSDNPRTENAAAIIEEVCSGFTGNWRSDGKIAVEPDRRAAIQKVIAMAEPGDVVLIAGKGHENYQIIGTTKHHFDDVEEAAAALTQRGL
jgi:UDP-N-acetylmuramoyl-L-alanyl-D-glutamate--2,6-diaminopimelate ligase